MPHIGGQELVLVLVLALLLLGGRKLPELGSSVGHGIQNFRRSLAGGGDGAPAAHAPAAESAGDPPERS